MRTLAITLALASFVVSRAAAQVTVELAMDQEEFLPGEPVPVAVKITNQSGQQIHLGVDPDWLTFTVESQDGFIVNKVSDVPVQGAFDLETSQMGTKHVDLAPSFVLQRPGHYTVTATLHMKDWNLKLNSTAKVFDVITGAKLWSQNFGVPNPAGAPEMREFTLEQASYLHSQMRLYLQVSDAAESTIFKTEALGSTVSFSRPEAQVDHLNQLHVLWQAGAQMFDYCRIDTDGNVIDREIYDDYGTRPKLVTDDSGDVKVVGGVRRPKPGDLPVIVPPAQVPSTTSAPAAK